MDYLYNHVCNPLIFCLLRCRNLFLYTNPSFAAAFFPRTLLSLPSQNMEIFKEINQAYAVLSDPSLRRDYDASGSSKESRLEAIRRKNEGNANDGGGTFLLVFPLFACLACAPLCESRFSCFFLPYILHFFFP